MAKKEHIIPTEIISVAGYSLSVMLMVFAAALYMGWLPANSGQADLAVQKPVVPVVKSPEAPPKTKVAEPAAPAQDQNAATETPPSKPAEEAVASEEPSLPTAETEPNDTQTEAPKPLESAEDESGDDQPSQPISPKQETAALESQTEETLPEAQATPPETDAAQETDVEAPPRSADTLTAQDRAAEAEAPQPSEKTDTAKPVEQDPQTEDSAKTDEPEPQTDDTAEAPSKAPAAPSAEAKVEPQKPKVRIIVPPEKTEAPKPAPSVVIRIPKDPTAELKDPAEELKVLPRPKLVPSAKPELVQQAPRVVVQIPQTQEQTGDQALRPVTPRAKPVRPSGGDDKTVVLPRVDPPQPSQPPKAKQPADKTAKSDSIADEQIVVERAPQPLAKPARIVRAPDHTAAVAPPRVKKVRIQRRAKRKPKAAGRRTQRSSNAAEPRNRIRRTRLARTRIHRPPVGEQPAAQSVSFDQDTYCLAIAIYYEAGRKNLREQVAVSREILHRVESFNFPNSVCEVVYQYAHRRGRCRYAFACDGLPDRPRNRSVWNRAKMLAKEQINCGPRCGCYLQKPTLVSSSKRRSRSVIRCRAGVRTPGPKAVAKTRNGVKLEIRPVYSRLPDDAVSSLGRIDR